MRSENAPSTFRRADGFTKLRQHVAVHHAEHPQQRTTQDHVVQMHDPEINAESCLAGCVRYARVHLGTGKENYAASRENQTDLGIEL